MFKGRQHGVEYVQYKSLAGNIYHLERFDNTRLA